MSAQLLAELELPVDQLRAVRLVAGRIALAEGLDEEAVEDVKLAAGEVCARFAAEGGTSGVRAVFLRESDAFTALFSRVPSPPAAAVPPSGDRDGTVPEPDLGWLILEAVVPQLHPDGDALRLSWPLPRLVARGS